MVFFARTNGSLDRGLILHLKLDDFNIGDSNPIIDHSLRGASVTVNGSPTNAEGINFRSKNSIDFDDSTNDFLQITGIDDNQTSISMSLWFNVDREDQNYSNPSIQVAFLWKQDDSPSLGLRSSFAIAFRVDNDTVFSTQDYTNKVWNHIAVVYDRESNSLRGYLNGSQEKELFSTNQRFSVADTTRVARDDAGRNVKGKIANVRIYDRALSGSEVSKLYRKRI